MNKPSFNAAELKRNFSGDEEILREMIQYFINAIPDSLATLQKNISNEDYRSLYFQAHKLRGLVQNFYSDEISNELQRLEICAKENKLEDAAILLYGVKNDLVRLGAELAEMVLMMGAS